MKKDINKFNKKLSNKFSKKMLKSSANNDYSRTLIDKTIFKNKQRKNKNQVYYSFLTIVLLICLIQISCSAILNVSKTISYQTKINTIKKTHEEAESFNRQLKQEINNFSTTSSLEAIARNNLKMAGQDEVLVIINPEQDKDLQSENNGKNSKSKKVKNGR